MICLVYAHPYPDRSQLNRALLEAVRTVPALEVRSLYDLYPDFAIDVEAEQTALERAHVIVFQNPIYWYSVPGLLKHWFDRVLSPGFAYGDGGRALVGKHCLWVTTTGASEQGYAETGVHERPFAEFVPPLEQTARFCGMQWADPLIVFGGQRVTRKELAQHAARYREQLIELNAFAEREAS